MWTSTLDLSLNRILLMKLLGRIYPDIYYSSLSPLRVANIPRPTLPAANWVRVRNRLAGICGSDLHLVYSDADARISVAAIPDYKHLYPGHEVVGEVIEIGEEVQHLRVGDRVVLQYKPNCLSTGAKPMCRACDSGNYNLCEYGILPGPQPIGGGWSEEMLLHEQLLFRLPIELTDEQGVMVEPTAVALHAVLRHLPQANDNILIIGAGTIGLLTLQVLRALAPKAHISMLARYPFQIEQATRMGADNIIYPPPADQYASVQRATQSRIYKGILNNRTLVGGYDVIYDTVGQQKTLHHALRWLRSQGTMVMVGLSLHMMHIDLTPIWHQEAHILGSLSHGVETWPQGASNGSTTTPARRSTFSIVTELFEQKRLQPEQLITHRFALNNYKDALKSASRKKNNQSVKVLFDYSLLPASAVPNVRASARPHRPALSQPHGDAFLEEILHSQNETLPRQDPEPETVPQSNTAQQIVPPKIFNTPPPQALSRESWRTILTPQDIAQDDTDDEDTDTAIPIVRPSSYTPRGTSNLTPSPRTPMPIARETPVDQNASSDKQANSSKPYQNWHINVRKPAEKQVTISAMSEQELPVQQQRADATTHLSSSLFNADSVPVTSLPVDPASASLIETPATTGEEPENRLSTPPQQNEELKDTTDSETPENVQDFTAYDIVPASPTAATHFTADTELIDNEAIPQSNTTPPSPDTISYIDNSTIITPPTDHTQVAEPAPQEHLLYSTNQIEHEDLLDFLRYIQPSEPIYQPTQTLPADVEQLPFPSSADHSALKLPAEAGEHVSPFSETINMHALTEEQLPSQNILDSLFNADTSSMPAFLEQLSSVGAHIAPTMLSEDANAPTLPDLASSDMPTLLDTSAISLPDVPTQPDLSSSNMPTLLDTSAISFPDEPDQSDLVSSDMSTLLDTSAISFPNEPASPPTPIATPPTDSSRQFDTTIASSTRKTKKRLKALKAAQAAKANNGKSQQDKNSIEKKTTQQFQIEETTTSSIPEQTLINSNTTGNNDQNTQTE